MAQGEQEKAQFARSIESYALLKKKANP